MIASKGLTVLHIDFFRVQINKIKPEKPEKPAKWVKSQEKKSQAK